MPITLMMIQLFDYNDCRKYLKAAIEQATESGYGVQSKLARALGCQASHISKVLGGSAQLSLEQADLVNEFFDHTPEQSDYFIFLVEHDRASTTRLKTHFRRHLDRLREQHVNMKERFKVKDHLSEQDQARFYSHWYFGAIHAALSIESLRTSEAVARHFHIPKKRVLEVLRFFEETGMAVKTGDQYLQAMNKTHLGKDSYLISKHHANWRMQAVRSIENNLETDLHYSAITTLSKEDMFRIKANLVRAVEEANAVIRDSKEEIICGFCLDFFQV